MLKLTILAFLCAAVLIEAEDTSVPMPQYPKFLEPSDEAKHSRVARQTVPFMPSSMGMPGVDASSVGKMMGNFTDPVGFATNTAQTMGKLFTRRRRQAEPSTTMPST